jgi:uncharacterized protein
MSAGDLRVIQTASGVRFTLTVSPRASRSAIAGVRDQRLLVRVTAPPVDGAANAATIALLAEVLDLPRRHVAIEAGETTRRKTVHVAGITAAALRMRLDQILT